MKNRGIKISIDLGKKTITTKLFEFLPREDFEDYKSIHKSLGFRFIKKSKINLLKYNREDFEKFADEYIKIMKNRFKDKIKIERK